MSRTKSMSVTENMVAADGVMGGDASMTDDMTAWQHDYSDPKAGEDDFEAGDQSGNAALSVEYGYGAEDDSLPELTEEEMFGEGRSDELTEASDREKAEEKNGAVETAYSEDAPVSVKPKRTSRKRKQRYQVRQQLLSKMWKRKTLIWICRRKAVPWNRKQKLQ